MKEYVLIAVLSLFTEVVVPRVAARFTSAPETAAAEESQEAKEAPEAEDADDAAAAEADEVEDLREENRLLKQIVVEKELLQRRAAEDSD